MVVKETDIIVDKGTDSSVDSYSGFGTPPEKTILNDELQKLGIDTVICVGLAFDYCVGLTAVDAAKHGYKTYIVVDGTKAVAKESKTEMKDRLKQANVTLIRSTDI